MALSRGSDPPGLGRLEGAQRAAKGTIHENRYNLSDPGVHQTIFPARAPGEAGIFLLIVLILKTRVGWDICGTLIV